MFKKNALRCKPNNILLESPASRTLGKSIFFYRVVRVPGSSQQCGLPLWLPKVRAPLTAKREVGTASGQVGGTLVSAVLRHEQVVYKLRLHKPEERSIQPPREGRSGAKSFQRPASLPPRLPSATPRVGQRAGEAEWICPTSLAAKILKLPQEEV